MNEKLFPPENGKKIKITGPVESATGNLNQLSQFIDLSGRVKNPINSMDVWATHDRYFYNLYGMPDKTKKVKISLDLKLDEHHWTVVKPFLIYLRYITNNQYTGVEQDKHVIEVLRKI